MDLLRRSLRDMPNDSLLWMSYGNRLQSDGRFDPAYIAFNNAVEVDAGNFAALESFIAMAASRQEFSRVREVLTRLPEAIKGRPHRLLPSLDFSIPNRIDEAVDVVAREGDMIAQAVVELHRSDGQATLEDLDEVETAQARAIFCLARGRRAAAIETIRQLPEDKVPVTSLRLAIRRELARDQHDAAPGLLSEYLRARPDDAWAKNKLRVGKVRSDHQLAQSGFPFPPAAEIRSYSPQQNKVAYLLHNSLPYHSAGYSTRTHGLLSAVRQQGWDMVGVTRLGYPYDMPQYKELGPIQAIDIVNGVPYHRLSTEPGLEMKKPIQQYVDRYVERLKVFAEDEKPFLLHAASNHWNGLAAVSAALQLGLPSVYEVRGLWEVTRGSRDPEWASGGMYRFMARMEADAASNATHVLAITHALKSELIARGVDGEKITVVPNGVDSSRFRRRERDRELAQSLGINNKTVIGYVGSILDYEGLGLLIESAGKIASERDDFVVLLVGDGAELEKFRTEVEIAGLQHLFRFTGRVPHEEVERYYSLIDITPFPRLPLPVCEMVSPLKPFEAMSMEKAVVASDVAALAEIVRHGETGLLHEKGNADSLATALRQLLDNHELRSRLAVNGRRWVTEERQWSQLGRTISDIYESLGGRSSAPAVLTGAAALRVP
ncbi:hypothetical protein GCM10022261_08940 [Brevibacterium daeguense]|uniref:D-inositol 3-phosphate glycosyltransferase n=1 Tax=Brevibacterium daeguense TaxID=909936 RepID=A0ABP8EHB9_9MICO|nr:glycosyltransferase [Brevibacterium daeguense]